MITRVHPTLSREELLRKALFSGNQFNETEFPPPRLLMEPWLCEASYNLIYAPAGVGKTFFSIAVAHTVATGRKMLNWRAVNSAGVLYVDGEVGCTEMQSRILRISGGVIPSNFHVISTPQMVVEGGSVMNLAYKDWRDTFMVVLRSLPDIKLIVVDNISSLFSGLKMNDEESWSEPNQFFIGLRALGYCILLIHHSGKELSGGPRGTSLLEGSVNMLIQLSRIGGIDNSDGCHLNVRWEKSRSVIGEAIRDRKIYLVDDLIKPYFADFMPMTDERQKIYDYLSTHPDAVHEPVRALVDKIGVSKSLISVVIKGVREDE